MYIIEDDQLELSHFMRLSSPQVEPLKQNSKVVSTHLWNTPLNLNQQAFSMDSFHSWRTGNCPGCALWVCCNFLGRIHFRGHGETNPAIPSLTCWRFAPKIRGERLSSSILARGASKKVSSQSKKTGIFLYPISIMNWFRFRTFFSKFGDI